MSTLAVACILFVLAFIISVLFGVILVDYYRSVCRKVIELRARIEQLEYEFSIHRHDCDPRRKMSTPKFLGEEPKPWPTI